MGERITNVKICRLIFSPLFVSAHPPKKALSMTINASRSVSPLVVRDLQEWGLEMNPWIRDWFLLTSNIWIWQCLGNSHDFLGARHSWYFFILHLRPKQKHLQVFQLALAKYLRWFANCVGEKYMQIFLHWSLSHSYFCILLGKYLNAEHTVRTASDCQFNLSKVSLR